MKRQAISEDFRRLGLAVVILGVVGGLLQQQVPAGVAVGFGLLGILLWGPGIWLTQEVEQ